MKERGKRMLQEVATTRSVVGGTKDLVSFMDNRESIVQTLTDFAPEPNEELNLPTDHVRRDGRHARRQLWSAGATATGCWYHTQG